MKQRYRALKSASTVIELMAVLLGIVGIIGGILTMFGTRGGFGTGLVICIAAVVSMAFLVSFARLILLLIDIEANTRATADFFRRRKR